MNRSAVVRSFEQAFVGWLGLPYAFAFWKGRVALYAILKGLDVGTGDEVVLPGYTCVMNVNPIKYSGATPIYADIEPETYNVRPDLIEAGITPKTKAIIAQHTYGYPCRMDEIMDVANRHGLPLIEDCCLAMGSTYKGRLCGTMGVAAYWSFQWNKPFTMGLGGMACTGDRELAGRIESLCERELVRPGAWTAGMLGLQRLVYRAFIYPRTTAMATSLFRWLTRIGLVVGSSSAEEFSPDMQEDFLMGMSDGQAKAGLRQVGRIDRNIEHRRRMRQVYEQLLQRAGWPVPPVPEFMDPVLVRYPVRVADKARAVAEAPGRFVELGTWFECPLHPIETPMTAYDYIDGMCPEAEKACREVVNMPMHMRASRRTVRRSVDFVASIGWPQEAS